MTTARLPSFSWLHLTDLHMGMDDHRLHLPDVQEALFADLTVLHAKSGPWDAVLFTGDLTQRGTKEQFEDLRRVILAPLFERLRELGSTPVLIPVPGNHDLARPEATDPALASLLRWHDDDSADLRKRFWQDRHAPERRLVTDAFAAYSRFLKAQTWPSDVTVRRGVLPGDLAVSFERNGLTVALVALNSSFLQLAGGDFLGKLTIDREQLLGVCGDNPPTWIADHEVALLLTHHPRAWLHPSAQKTFDMGILARDRFVAHLYGHMHLPRVTSEAIGGGPERRSVQGPSFFGLERYGDHEERAHGFMAGRITVDGDRGELRLWPRELIVTEAGYYKSVPVERLDLDDGALVRPFTPRPRRVRATPTPPVATPPDTGDARARARARERLEALTSEAFDAVMKTLLVPAHEVTGADRYERAYKAARYLEARGKLGAIDAALTDRDGG